MKTVRTILDLVAIAGLLIGFGYVTCSGLMRPGSRDAGWMHDPRIYLPLAAAVFPMCAWLWWREWLKARRQSKRLAQLRQELAEASAAIKRGQSGAAAPAHHPKHY